MTLFELAEQQRKDLLKRATAANHRLLLSYAAAWQRIEDELQTVFDKLAKTPQQLPDGSPNPAFSISWLGERDRLTEIRRQLALEIQRVAAKAAADVRGTQSELVKLAARHATTQLKAAASQGVTASFDHFNAGALKEFVGLVPNGSPLKESFQRLAADAGKSSGDRLEEIITQGIAAGDGLPKIFNQVKREFDVQDSAIARRFQLAVQTSVLTSYRQATRQAYKAAGVKKWRWLSARQVHTCPACWALDGQIFDIDEPQRPHPSCRCTLVPVFEEQQQTDGETEFAALTEQQKKSTLGNAAYAAYRDGRLALEDLAAQTDGGRGYGPQWNQRSLKGALGEELAKTYWRQPSRPAARQSETPYTPKFALDVAEELGMQWEQLLAVVRRVGTGPLEDVQAAAVRGYTGNIFDGLNRSLRSGSPSDFARKYTQILNSGLRELTARDGWVERVVMADRQELAAIKKRYQVGATVVEQPFTSATLNRAADGPVKFLIYSKQGRLIEEFSSVGVGSPINEREVLFSAGSRFRVLAAEQQGKTFTVTMKELL